MVQNIRPLRKTKIGSHEFLQEYFGRFRYINPCKTCDPWQSIPPLSEGPLYKAACRIL